MKSSSQIETTSQISQVDNHIEYYNDSPENFEQDTVSEEITLQVEDSSSNGM